MLIFWVCLILVLAVALLGFLGWLILRIFGVRKHGKRTLKYSAICAVVVPLLMIFVVGPIWMSSFLADLGTRPFDLDFPETPASCGRAFEDVHFSSRDGVQLSGWFLDGEDDRPSVVVSHGLFRNRHEVLRRGCDLNAKGFPVLLFDFRNHSSKSGASGRKETSLGYWERLDVAGAVDCLRRRKSNDGIILVGVSMGAVASVLAAQELSPPPQAIIADSPFLNLRETIDRHVWLFLGLPSFPFSHLFIWNLTRIENFEPDQLDVARALQQLPPIPTLLLYGAADDRMPEETARAVYDAIPHSSKRLVFFDGAGHGGAYGKHPQEYIAEIASFLAMNQGGEAPGG